MPIYKIELSRSAVKSLKKLPKHTSARIFAKIKLLATDPRPMDTKKLVGLPSFRIRVGDYRVIYSIDDEIVTVLVVKVAHRREVYR